MITLRLDASMDGANDQSDGATISVPFKATLPLRKGVSHSPSGPRTIDEATRSALLTSIARSRAWVDTIFKDPAADIGTIAKRENLAERRVRFLAPLAYLSPRVIEAIAEGRAPAYLTVTRLARNLPTVWPERTALQGRGQ
jgi:site-specific DNA recombinase